MIVESYDRNPFWVIPCLRSRTLDIRLLVSRFLSTSPCFPVPLFPCLPVPLSPCLPISLLSLLLFSTTCWPLYTMTRVSPLSHSCHRADLDSFHHCSHSVSLCCFYDCLLACLSCRTYACPSCCVTYRANATDIGRMKWRARPRSLN